MAPTTHVPTEANNSFIERASTAFSNGERLFFWRQSRNSL